MATSFVAADGAVIIPEEILAFLGLEKGGQVEFEVIEIFAKLTTSSAFKLENLAVLVHSIRQYATTSADFADCLIAGVARQAGCAYTLTLDRKAGSVPGMRRLK